MLALLLCVILVVVAKAAITTTRDAFPQIISHRGASGYVPEHSLQAYQLAMDLFTDYVETDLCLSKDGVLVAMHDVLLDTTTDVASFPQFADRKTTRVVDGKTFSGFFINDFTLEELKQLSLKQRLDFRTTMFDGYFKIPTLTEIIPVIQAHNSAENSRFIGFYIELKHPSYFNTKPNEMETKLLATLQSYDYLTQGDQVPRDMTQILPIIIECFDTAALKYMSGITTIPLIHLFEPEETPAAFWNNATLYELSTYVQGIGPEKSYFANISYEQALQTMELIHNINLRIHPWTFRADSGIVPKANNDFNVENIFYLCCLGMDGVFTEFPDRSRESLDNVRNYTYWKYSSNSNNNKAKIAYKDTGFKIGDCPIECK